MGYKRKTTDEWQIWGNYGCGDEEVTAAASLREAMQLRREYNANEPGVRHYIRKVRVPRPNKSAGQIAYELSLSNAPTYLSGAPRLPWAELSMGIQEAWEKTARGKL